MDPKLDAIHKYKGEWYFWNETFTKRIGSYVSKVGAKKARKDFLKELEEEKEESNDHRNIKNQ